MQIWVWGLRLRVRVAFKLMNLDLVSMVKSDKMAEVWAPPSLRDWMTRKQTPVGCGEKHAEL